MTWTFSAFADEAGDTIDEQIEACREGGLRHIDLRMIDGHNISDLPADDAAQVKRKLDTAGLTVAMLGSPIGKIDIADDVAPDLARLEHLGEMSKVFDCNRVRVFSYYNKGGLSAREWGGQCIDRLRRLIDLAGRQGQVLYLENEKGIYGESGERTLEIAESCRDGQVFRTLFDFDNFNQCAEDVWHAWTLVRDHTDGFHLKDSTAPPDPMHVPIGEGNGRAADILGEALVAGFSGPLSLEPHLAYGGALLSVGHSGRANQDLADMTPAQCFRVAVEAARGLFAKIGAEVI